MNFEFIEEMVRYSKDIKSKKVRFSVQTNGSLLSDDIVDYLIDNNIHISISLDGTEKLHNKTRPYINGSPSYANVIKGIERVMKRNQQIDLITVVTKYNASNLKEIAEDYNSMGFNKVLFSPVCPTNSIGTTLVPNNKILTREMKNIFDIAISKTKNDKNFIKVRNLSDTLAQLFAPKSNDVCLQCGGYGTYHPLLAVDIDGYIYPCDNFLGNNGKYSIGNILTDDLKGVLNSKQNFREYRKIEKIESCNVCDWGKICGNGCPNDPINRFDDIYKPSIYCSYYDNVFEYLIKKIPMLYETDNLNKILFWPSEKVNNAKR